MRKRILSLLLCIVLCLSFAPTAVFAASDIGSLSGNGNIEDREWNLRLDENGILHWDNAVEGPHIIQLYYNGIAAGANMNATGDSWDLQSYMRDAKKVTGKYTILFNGSSTVRNSEEVSFYYISPLAQLSAPANLSWNGQAGTWDAVPNATQYRIYLRHGDGNLRDTYYTNNTSYDFGTMAQDGFVFEVVATADNYLYSNAVTSPRYGSSQPGTITVTYDANGGTGTMAQETYTLDSEGWVKNFTVPECGFTAPAGKEFDHWENSNGTPYQVGGTPWIAESMILKAIWKDSTTPQPTTYTVSFEMNSHGDQIAAQTVNEGAKATKPTDPTASGWTFDGWYADATFSAAFDFDTAIAADTTIYAKWTANSVTPPTPANYTVTFNMNGHGTQVAAQTVEDGNKATKPADPTASGYTFGGWYADATFSTKFDFNSAITANTTVYAKWTKNSVAPTDPTTPQTGDNSNMFLWIVLLFVSGGALAGTAVYGKKKKYRAE